MSGDRVVATDAAIDRYLAINGMDTHVSIADVRGILASFVAYDEPAEIAAELKRAAERLGSEGRASIVFLSTNDPRGFVHASIENTWRNGADRQQFRVCSETFEAAFAELNAWVDGAPMRNRVVTAADLGLEIAA